MEDESNKIEFNEKKRKIQHIEEKEDKIDVKINK